MEFLKKHRFLLAVLVILFLLGKGFLNNFSGSRAYPTPMVGNYVGSKAVTSELSFPSMDLSLDRMVIQDTSMSLVVKDVRGRAEQIENKAKEVDGYMVSSSLTKTEEAPYATIVLRIPSDRLKDTLDYYRNLAVKVSSEYVLGTDVTDQYDDIDERLRTLEKTKAKFEAIMDQTTNVQETLTVQREIINLQDQIDRLKGQQKYLEQTAKLSKVTIYLSSDEFSLPYVPDKPFRPNVIFKLAVRSLVGTLRGVVSFVIWVGVYAVVWLPIILVVYLIKRRRKTA